MSAKGLLPLLRCLLGRFGTIQAEVRYPHHQSGNPGNPWSRSRCMRVLWFVRAFAGESVVFVRYQYSWIWDTIPFYIHENPMLSLSSKACSNCEFHGRWDGHSNTISSFWNVGRPYSDALTVGKIDFWNTFPKLTVRPLKSQFTTSQYERLVFQPPFFKGYCIC